MSLGDAVLRLTVTDLVVGIALAVFGLGSAFMSRRARHLSWVPLLVGVWAIIAPWVVSGNVATTATSWSNVVTGVIAVLLGVAAMSIKVAPTP